MQIARHMHDILTDLLQAFQAVHRPSGPPELQILETGSIREDTEQHRKGDGWSTLTFAKYINDNVPGGYVTSIDLNVDVAERVLQRERVSQHVVLREGYSIEWMASMLAAGQRFDVILLDSDNDPQLILHEFLIAQKLLRRPGLILVDDVVPDSKTIRKGELLLPWLRGRGAMFDVHPRAGSGFLSGVLSVVCE